MILQCVNAPSLEVGRRESRRYAGTFAQAEALGGSGAREAEQQNQGASRLAATPRHGSSVSGTGSILDVKRTR